MRLEAHESVFAYVRTLGPTRAWVVLNFSADEVEVPLQRGVADGPGPGPGPGLVPTESAGSGLNLGLGLPLGRDGCQRVLCNYGGASTSATSASRLGLDINVEGETLALRGYEARVYVGYTPTMV